MLGIGSVLRADDAAGVRTARHLQRELRRFRPVADVAVFLGGTAPENLSGSIRAFAPTHVVMLDAAEMGEVPGSARLLNVEALDSARPHSTHSMPLSLLAGYLRASIGCEVVVIGIQPESTAQGGRMSKSVRRAAREVALSLASVMVSRQAV